MQAKTLYQYFAIKGLFFGAIPYSNVLNGITAINLANDLSREPVEFVA